MFHVVYTSNLLNNFDNINALKTLLKDRVVCKLRANCIVICFMYQMYGS